MPQTNPFDRFDNATKSGPIVLRKADPSKAEDKRLDRIIKELTITEKEKPDKPKEGYRWSADGKTQEIIPGGPADPAMAAKTGAPTEAEYKGNSFLIRALGAEGRYRQANGDSVGPRSYGGQILNDVAPGMLNNLPGGMGNSPERQVIDQAINNFIIAAVLRQDTGAAVSPTELDRYRTIYFPVAGDSKEVIAAKAQARAEALQGLYSTAGRAITPEVKSTYDSLFPNGGTVPSTANDASPINSGVPDGSTVGAGVDSRLSGGATGAEGWDVSINPETLARPAPMAGSTDTITATPKAQYVSGEKDRQYAAALQSAFNKNATPAELDAIAAQFGYPPPSSSPLFAKWISKRDKQGIYEPVAIPQTELQQPTEYQKDTAANAASPLGTAAIGAGNAVTFGLQDEIAGGVDALTTGKPLAQGVAEARYKESLAQAANPTAYTVGQIGGGLAQGIGVNKALGMAGRGIGANAALDVGLGAAYGAGENNDDRLSGAMKGAVAGGVGSVLGRGGPIASGKLGLNAETRMLADNGVRTTLGQNFNKIGGNTAEELFAKVPFAGAGARTARSRSFDDFQRGYLNQSLAPLGTTIPPKVKIGTAAMGYAQKAFSTGYDDALRNMKVAVDGDLISDMRDIGTKLSSGVVDDAVSSRVQKIIKNQIGDKLAANGGVLDGETYKDIHSTLRKIESTARKSQNYELEDTLGDVRSALDNAARRSSPPEAVAALDKVDEGYALFVRAEKAASAGGAAKADATFTPTELSGAAKALDNSVRSKAFLRGGALGQAYADAGKKVLGKPPTPSNGIGAAIGTGAGIGSIYAPKVALAGAGLMTAYAPGVRDVLGAVSRPSTARDNAIMKIARPTSQALLSPWIEQ